MFRRRFCTSIFVEVVGYIIIVLFHRYRLAVWSGAILLGILIYALFAEKVLNAHDPANYVMAVKYGFAVKSERPHAPGSPLLIEIWTAMHSLLGIEPHDAIVLLNVFFYVASILLCFEFTHRLFGRDIALLATAFFAVNPVTIYFASIAEIYIYDAFFALAILSLVRFLSPRQIWISAFLYGIGGGFRLSTLILLLPAVIFILSIRRKEFNVGIVLLSVVAFCIGIAIWILPYYYSSLHGFRPLVTALSEAGNLSSTFAQNAAAFGSWLFWSMHIAIVLFIWKAPAILSNSRPLSNNSLLLFAWSVPPSIFFLASHYAKGYILLILPAFAILVAYIVLKYTSLRMSTALIGTGCAGILFFSLAPFIPPGVESSLPKEQRTASERMETAVLRTFSFFAPTNAHIQESERAITEARTMLMRHSPPGAVVYMDRSAGIWAYPRSLQVSHPNIYFVAPEADDKVTIYHESGILRGQSAEQILSQTPIYYLIDKRLLHVKPISSAKLLEAGERVALLVIEDTTRTFLLNR